MIPKTGYRFSEKIMLQQSSEAAAFLRAVADAMMILDDSRMLPRAPSCDGRRDRRAPRRHLDARCRAGAAPAVDRTRRSPAAATRRHQRAARWLYDSGRGARRRTAHVRSFLGPRRAAGDPLLC